MLSPLTFQSNTLIAEGTDLLTMTGDLYGSAIKHGIVSLQNSVKHVTRLASTRTSKLRDTMSAILEFESGMKSLNQWFKTTESSLKYSLTDWNDSTVIARYVIKLAWDHKLFKVLVTREYNRYLLLNS